MNDINGINSLIAHLTQNFDGIKVKEIRRAITELEQCVDRLRPHIPANVLQQVSGQIADLKGRANNRWQREETRRQALMGLPDPGGWILDIDD